RYGESRGLKPHQTVPFENFLDDTNEGQLARIYVQGFEIRNVLDSIIINQAPWRPSDDMKATAVFFSASLTSYCGDTPVELVVERLLALGGTDLPPNIASNQAALSRMREMVSYSLMQLRSDVKKHV
ncbi:hypothetical protein DL96DRAFT_1438223, partial [Flagelloscypha sp. PMI_526]